MPVYCNKFERLISAGNDPARLALLYCVAQSTFARVVCMKGGC